MIDMFADINVLLDVLLNRTQFYADSSAIWNLAERKKVNAYISAISFPTVYYIVRKFSDRTQADTALVKMRNVFVVTDCNFHIIDQAINSGLPDFEDAVQYFSAVGVNAACIVTRNTKHFPLSKPPALTPSAFLELNSFI